MDITFQGEQDVDELTKNLMAVLHLFQERYHVGHFREVHLLVTLVSDGGEDVELVDTETNAVYRRFEVRKETEMSSTPAPAKSKQHRGHLHLVVDNTHFPEI
ncbi:MAG: hypothetical protein Q8R79_02355 [Legionellaceae bacterium]|nr:hypothetical protein [Legionellaceae bacterium]